MRNRDIINDRFRTIIYNNYKYLYTKFVQSTNIIKNGLTNEDVLLDELINIITSPSVNKNIDKYSNLTDAELLTYIEQRIGFSKHINTKRNNMYKATHINIEDNANIKQEM